MYLIQIRTKLNVHLVGLIPSGRIQLCFLILFNILKLYIKTTFEKAVKTPSRHFN